MPPPPHVQLLQRYAVMYARTEMLKYALKMVPSMHNEADAQDYIVWHRI